MQDKMLLGSSLGDWDPSSQPKQINQTNRPHSGPDQLSGYTADAK